MIGSKIVALLAIGIFMWLLMGLIGMVPMRIKMDQEYPFKFIIPATLGIALSLRQLKQRWQPGANIPNNLFAQGTTYVVAIILLGCIIYWMLKDGEWWNTMIRAALSEGGIQ